MGLSFQMPSIRYDLGAFWAFHVRNMGKIGTAMSIISYHWFSLLFVCGLWTHLRRFDF